MRIIASILFIYFAVLSALFIFQEKFQFFPDSRDFDQCPGCGNGSGLQAIRKGEVRYYWEENPNALGTLVFFHGNAGNAYDRTWFSDVFRDLPLNFALVEYPGFSKGNPLDSNLKANQESILSNALKAVEEITKASTLPLFIYGESLGTGVSTYVASQLKVAALIIQAPYPSIGAVAQHHYPVFPVKWILRNPFPAGEWAKSVTCPVLGIHGVVDQVIPIRFGRAQIENFPGTSKWIELPHSGHGDYLVRDQRQFRAAIGDFILEILQDQGNN